MSYPRVSYPTEQLFHKKYLYVIKKLSVLRRKKVYRYLKKILLQFFWSAEIKFWNILKKKSQQHFSS